MPCQPAFTRIPRATGGPCACVARREEVEELRKLTLEQVQQFYAAHLLPSSRTRRKLAVHVAGRAHLEQLGHPAPPGAQLVADPAALKQQQALFPAVLGQP